MTRLFTLTRPKDSELEALLRRQADARLSYGPVGLSDLPSQGYTVDVHTARVGRGRADLERARHAIDAWHPLRLGWTQAHPAGPTPQIGTDVVLVARTLGLWSVNPCRVVRRFPESPDDGRYGFAYGTLPDHAAAGEESFSVTIDDDEVVRYTIRAASRARHPLMRAGYPLSRWLQGRFRRDSALAVARAVRG